MAKRQSEPCGAVCDVVVIGPNTRLPEGIDAEQMNLGSSFIIEVIKARFSRMIPSMESFLFDEPTVMQRSLELKFGILLVNWMQVQVIYQPLL